MVKGILGTGRRGKAELSEDVLRHIFELALENYPSRTNSNLLRVCSTINAWLEPILYENVVLSQESSFFPFIEALRSPSARFPTQHVKKLWLLSRFLPYHDGLKILTQRCPKLEQFACRSFWLTNAHGNQGPIHNAEHQSLRKLLVLNTNLHLEHLGPGPLHLLTHIHISEFNRVNYGTLQNYILPRAAELVSLTHLSIEVRMIMFSTTDLSSITAGLEYVKRLFGMTSNKEETIPSLQVVTFIISGLANELPDPSAFEKARIFFASEAKRIDNDASGDTVSKRIIVESKGLTGEFTIETLERELSKISNQRRLVGAD